MRLLGDNGSGYELAQKLEENSTWRAWLGEIDHVAIQQHLATPGCWSAFMQSDNPSVLILQLRVRALLFDKAVASLYLETAESATASALDSSCKFRNSFLILSFYVSILCFSTRNSDTVVSSFLKPLEFFWKHITNLSSIKSCTLAKQINKRKVQQNAHLNKSIVVTILYFSRKVLLLSSVRFWSHWSFCGGVTNLSFTKSCTLAKQIEQEEGATEHSLEELLDLLI